MMLGPVERSKEAVRFLKTIEKIYLLKDIDAILDQILLEARKLARADAGSIFLKQGDRLRFSYVHNDTLFRAAGANAALYADFSVPIDEHSIVGCSALTGRTIAIDNAYAISPDLPYRFDPRYDRQSGYRTVSILSIPLKTFEDKSIGVLQLINATDSHGRIVPFSPLSRRYVPLFANSASVAIERGIMTRELILRMMRMAELHDPSETGAHVQKVGLFSAEIYQQWALNRGIDKQEMAHVRELIRLAAMLHDAGKVGISDLILKKEGRLTPDEYDTMKWHAVYGARLFLNVTSDLDRMCYEIALCHHEKWNGSGYPGR